MKSFSVQTLALCATLAAAGPYKVLIHQDPVVSVEIKAEDESAVDVPVPGHNNGAIYGPVPKADQLFQVEALEVAPLPIVGYVMIAPFPSGRSPLGR